MFDERPYRQQPKSVWSIWWFVAIMAAGLTAWHLELVPFNPFKAEQIALRDHPVEEFPDSYSEEELAAKSTDRRAGYSPDTPDFRLELSEFQQEPPSESVEPPAVMIDSGAATQLALHQSEPDQGAPPLQQYRRDETPASSRLPMRTAAAPQQTAMLEPQQNSGVVNAAGTVTQSPEQTPQPIVTTSAAAREPNQLPSAFQLAPEAEQDVLRLRELSSLYWQNPDQRAAIEDELMVLSHKIYFTDAAHYLPPHTVQPNQHLETIAGQYDVSWQYLSSLNGVSPEKLRAGQEIKIIQGPFDAVVELSQMRLTIHAHGYVVAHYPIGIGTNGSTPAGQFAVLNKQDNPTYYGPEGVISCDDPQNPLGEYWIDLGDSIGIHGTNDPSSIGKAASKGCIRMYDGDVAQVFDLLTTSSRVAIRP
ncbi:L,D-transpeptidase family protein [Rubinisphaera margarita]|uniref:L,D-transpeptidase family protein n=1 Tax=Rubinisphaera margarita TaxID=2909586 RepID=UPI001EE7A205|nr:L,D-transpeptidase family protein [Rubinisphaera margarita]MCG6156791.1 L,D-transpeptidase family protein [Rubinisphaera margarita]